jgi:ubiquinone/menaquinone biosynthesis C-methylase UbiE
MKKENSDWKFAEEQIRKLKEILNRIEIAVSKKKINWAEENLKQLIDQIGVVGEKLQIGHIIDKGKDVLLNWYYQKKFKELGVKEKKVVGAKELYKLWAKYYEKIDNPMFGFEEGRFIPMMGNVKGKKILDLGCGTGRNAIFLAKKGAEVYGIDFSDEMIAEIRKKIKKEMVKIKLKKQDITKRLPYDSNSFDIVVSDFVFNHIKNLKPLLNEIARVLKPGGFCLASDVHPYFVDPKDYGAIPFVIPLGLWLKERYMHKLNEYLDVVNKNNLKLEIFEYAYTLKEIEDAKKQGKKLKIKRPLLLIVKMTKKN